MHAFPRTANHSDHDRPTQTMLPLPDSPAIGAFGSNGRPFDQRGIARTFPIDLSAV